jgi:hypothetical protein
MDRAILRCDEEATKILHAFIKTVERKKPSPKLYHYTNDVGLAGIIESGPISDQRLGNFAASQLFR